MIEAKKEKQSTKVYTRVFLVFLFLCLVFSGVCFQYYKSLHATIREESKGYLQEVARRVGSNLDRIISDNYAVLNTMAAGMETEDIHSFLETQKILQKQQGFWNYENVMLVDETGKAYDLNNREVFLTFDNKMRADVLEGKETMSPAQTINNKEYIVFYVPIQNLEIAGKKMIALAASYDPASFDQVLSMKSFNEQAYSQIVSKSGTAITRSTSEYTLKTGYNVFATLEKTDMDRDSSFDSMLKDISEDREGQIGFMLDGVHRYMVYTPIAPEDWYLLTFVPVQAVNEKSDMLLKTTLMLCGFITIAFAALIAGVFFIFNNNKRKLEKIAYVDEVTGGNTIQRFYVLARDALDTVLEGQRYAMIYTNIEKFKVLNDQFGRENCNQILRFFNEYIQNSLRGKECMGRLSADNFCVLLHYTDESGLLERFKDWKMGAEQYIMGNDLPWGLPTTEFGIYVIENNEMSFPQMIDRAKLSLRESLWSIDSKFHYAFYNEDVRNLLFREKQLEDRMEEALAKGEFEVYLQPKYSLPQEKIGGAEALVRWTGSPEGMIYPNEFIPLFEKNGFIIKLDLWVFEKVCCLMNHWIQSGLEPIKISVNCSRVHFRSADFLIPYVEIAERYGVDKQLIEIELTEGIVFENSSQLMKLIGKIGETGFGCSMDDFGSGYSTLNLIQMIPVDTLKLDQVFFRTTEADPKRTEAVVKNIVSMAKALSMETVAEGIEKREQVEMLKRAGCDYIQGYIFARPMTITDFEKLAYGEKNQM